MTQYREASRNIDGSATLTTSKQKRPYRFIGLATQATVDDVVDDWPLMFDFLFDVTLSTDVGLTISGHFESDTRWNQTPYSEDGRLTKDKTGNRHIQITIQPCLLWTLSQSRIVLFSILVCPSRWRLLLSLKWYLWDSTHDIQFQERRVPCFRRYTAKSQGTLHSLVGHQKGLWNPTFTDLTGKERGYIRVSQNKTLRTFYFYK